jgi:hypothetical protein
MCFKNLVNVALLGAMTLLLSSCGHTVLGANTYGWFSAKVIRDVKVDKLRVRHVRVSSDTCTSGYKEHLEIDGEIGPDSTAAIERLLPQISKCVNTEGVNIVPLVYLNSFGGYLSDGYALGELFREYSVQTVIVDGQVCASSCAIAFLGGKYRRMWRDDSILLFHSPYTTSGIGIDCSDTGQVAGLKKYYRNVLGEKDGDYLLSRTLSYCSSSSGWAIKKDAAELFNITN